MKYKLKDKYTNDWFMIVDIINVPDYPVTSTVNSPQLCFLGQWGCYHTPYHWHQDNIVSEPIWKFVIPSD